MSFLDLIDFRAFSSLWYWLFVSLIWMQRMSTAMGVPLDLLRRAEAGDAGARTALEALSNVAWRARVGRSETLVAIGVGIWAFGLSVLVLLGVGYGVELAQAGLLIALPLAVAQVATWRTARVMASTNPRGEALRACLFRLNRQVQWIGIAAVFITSIWGMLFNLASSTF